MPGMPGMAGGGTGADAGAPIVAGGTIEIHAFDLGFQPSAIVVAAAGTYPVTFINDGATTHDLSFADGVKLSADSKQTVTGSVTVPAGGLTFLCSIPGHAQAGMTGSDRRGCRRLDCFRRQPSSVSRGRGSSRRGCERPGLRPAGSGRAAGHGRNGA